MAIVIQPYRAEHQKAVEDFNRRLQTEGADPDLVFYENSEPRWLPQTESSSLFNEFFLALDGEVVRGGYALKHQEFALPDGSKRSVGYYHHPLSEGIVDKRFAVVGGLLLRDAMQRSPLLYCLGMGGYDRPLPQMLVRLGWSHCLLPFYFRVVKPARFLREMQSLRTTTLRRVTTDIAASSGAAWVATKLFHSLRKMQAPQDPTVRVEPVEEFGAWIDTLWEQSRHRYSMTAVRNAETLRMLYPASDRHFIRLRISRHGKDIGWAVVGERRKDAKYGNLRVGSILDCWADPGETLSVIRAATRALERAEMDLIVSNQSHKEWISALRKAGFVNAQSNFIFAASKKLAELLQPFEQIKSQIHFTRADGDGLPRNF